MKKLVSVGELKPGMFVEELDRPWRETPYLIEGILITSYAQIDEIATYCKYVYITTKSPTSTKNTRPQPAQYKTHIIPDSHNLRTPFHGNHIYKDTHSVEKELPAAIESHKKAVVLMDQIKSRINQDLQLDVNAAKQLVDIITSSMIRNSEAMLLLNDFQFSNSGDYFTHAINKATYMIGFGRHLCLPTEELSILGLGGLLMDIGQLKLIEMLGGGQIKDVNQDHPHFPDHVKYGEEILSNMPGIPDKVIEITLQHHEREDQSGYPHSLAANQISSYARMAAIVDCYENLVTEGVSPGSAPLSPFEALKMLWVWTQRWLNAPLVQQFAHCIGLFPVGSLVELNTGEVAIVLSHNRIKRLLPNLMIILDENKKPYKTPWTLDLAQAEDEKKHYIVGALENKAYNINPQDYYL